MTADDSTTMFAFVKGKDGYIGAASVVGLQLCAGFVEKMLGSLPDHIAVRVSRTPFQGSRCFTYDEWGSVRTIRSYDGTEHGLKFAMSPEQYALFAQYGASPRIFLKVTKRL